MVREYFCLKQPILEENSWLKFVLRPGLSALWALWIYCDSSGFFTKMGHIRLLPSPCEVVGSF